MQARKGGQVTYLTPHVQYGLTSMVPKGYILNQLLSAQSDCQGKNHEDNKIHVQTLLQMSPRPLNPLCVCLCLYVCICVCVT